MIDPNHPLASVELFALALHERDRVCTPAPEIPIDDPDDARKKMLSYQESEWKDAPKSHL